MGQISAIIDGLSIWYDPTTKDKPQGVVCPNCERLGKTHITDKCLSVWAKNNYGGVNVKCHKCGWEAHTDNRKPLYGEPQRPRPAIAINNLEPQKAVVAYFNKRGISEQTLIANRVGYKPGLNGQNGWIAFHYFDGDELVNTKYRTKDKQFRFEPNAPLLPYGLNDVKNKKVVIFCEGEIDKLSFWEAGYENVISVPNGAPAPNAKTVNLGWLDAYIDAFEDKESIYLACDADAPGKRLNDELARRFGFERCKIVLIPQGCKDANDVLVKIGKSGIAAMIAAATDYPIRGIAEWADLERAIDLRWEQGATIGAKTGIPQFDCLLSFVPQEITVITAVPNTGKSTFIDQIAINLSIKNGWKFAFFSPETKISKHLQRLIEQVVGKPMTKKYNGQMSRDEYEEAKQFIRQNFFWIQADDQNFSLTDILACAQTLVKRHGINALIIDPWNALEHQYKETETKYIAEKLNEIRAFLRKAQIHIFIIAHPTKLPTEKDGMNFRVPTLYDIAGSANWYNVMDNGIVLHPTLTENDQFTTVYVKKIRDDDLGMKGSVEFNFNPGCKRFYPRGTTLNTQNYLSTSYESKVNQDIGKDGKEVIAAINDDDDFPIPF